MGAIRMGVETADKNLINILWSKTLSFCQAAHYVLDQSLSNM